MRRESEREAFFGDYEIYGGDRKRKIVEWEGKPPPNFSAVFLLKHPDEERYIEAALLRLYQRL